MWSADTNDVSWSAHVDCVCVWHTVWCRYTAYGCSDVWELLLYLETRVSHLICVRALSGDRNTLLYYLEDADVHTTAQTTITTQTLTAIYCILRKKSIFNVTVADALKGVIKTTSLSANRQKNNTEKRAHPLRCFKHTPKRTHTQTCQTSSAVPADKCMSSTVSNRLHPSSRLRSIIWSSSSIMPFYLLPTSSTHHSQHRAASTKHTNEDFLWI